MIPRTLKTLTALALVAALAGCSIFAPRTQTITINGEPADAKIIVNGNVVSTPASIEVRRNKNISIMVTKKGYHPYSANTGFFLSQWGILDVIGGVLFLFPIIGLASPGAYALDQDSFYYVLTPLE